MTAEQEARSWLLGPDATGRTLRIEGDRVGGDARGSDAALPRLPCTDGRIEAGRVNAHTHIYSGLVPFDMPPPDPPPEDFVQILERLWWRLDRALDPDSLHAAARCYVAEALLAGTTTLIDHHESPRLIEGSLDLLGSCCDELGMRALLCYGATERNGGGQEARSGLEECRRFLRASGSGLQRGAVALHASFTVSDATIRRACALCRETGAVLHLHLAEDRADLEDARGRGFAGPLERLLACDAPLEGAILAHGVHLRREQVEQINDQGAWLVQNPRSNHGNRVGYPGTLRHGRRVALGTDGYPADMDQESAFLRDSAAAQDDDAAAAAERANAGLALAGRLFGTPFDPELEPGSTADLRVIAPDGQVLHVVVGGRLVVRDGRLAGADIDEIREQAATQAKRLWRRMEKI